MQNEIDKMLQLAQNNLGNHILHPSEALIDNWTIWMACEVVDQWQTSSQIELGQDEIFNFIPKANLSTSLTELKISIKQLEIRANSTQDLELAEDEIEQYVKQIAKEIQKDLQIARIESMDSICQFISKSRQQISLKRLNAFLSDLCNTLSKQKNDSKSEGIKSLKRERSAWQAYFKLSKQLTTINEAVNDLHQQALWRAIYICFESLLCAEYYSAYSQVNLSLLQLCQTYLDSVTRSIEILNRIHNSLKHKSTIEVILTA